MRFVPLKSEETQAQLLRHKARNFLVRQLTQVTNAIRVDLGEFGIVAAKGVYNVGKLLEAGDCANLTVSARRPLRQLADQFFQT